MDFDNRYTLLELFAETTSSEEHGISFEGIHLPQVNTGVGPSTGVTDVMPLSLKGAVHTNLLISSHHHIMSVFRFQGSCSSLW